MRQYRKKLFVVITLLSIALAACAGAGVYYGVVLGVAAYGTEAGGTALANTIQAGIHYLVLAGDAFFLWVVPCLAAGILILGWILWLVLCLFAVPKTKPREAPAPEKQKAQSGKKDFLDQRLEQDRKRRLFLHTLSILQREGRLLDFFDEDLSRYADDQIGAAVRSIQEDCKKAVKKYINPKPVMDIEEGEPVTVEPGFDMDAITLVGNVAGEPPFEGVLKHRGWKAGKKEIPKLSDIQDAGIIIPAEVEIR